MFFIQFYSNKLFIYFENPLNTSNISDMDNLRTRIPLDRPNQGVDFGKTTSKSKTYILINPLFAFIYCIFKMYLKLVKNVINRESSHIE